MDQRGLSPSHTNCPLPHPRLDSVPSPGPHHAVGSLRLWPQRHHEGSGGAQPGQGSQDPQDKPQPQPPAPQHGPAQTSRAAAHLPGRGRRAGTGRGGSGRSSRRGPRRAGSATRTGPGGCSSRRRGLRTTGAGSGSGARPRGPWVECHPCKDSPGGTVPPLCLPDAASEDMGLGCPGTRGGSGEGGGLVVRGAHPRQPVSTEGGVLC